MKTRLIGILHALALLLLGCNTLVETDTLTLPAPDSPSAPTIYTPSRRYEPPPLDEGVPARLDIVAPENAGKGSFIGFRRTNGAVLPKQGETHPILVVESIKGAVPGNALEVGDVVLAVNGKVLSKDATRDFRNALGDAQKDSGYLWITRLRGGEVSRIMINLGTKPLDLTRGAPPGDTRDWRLGPIGANGWCFHLVSGQGASNKARQILVTAVDKDGPAASKLQLHDVILGADGKPFAYDARMALAAAIDNAEKAKNQGALKLLVWREEKVLDVTLTLPVLGTYSDTVPFNCPKTEKIVDNAVAYMMKNNESLLKPEGWINYINGLGLLATGREDVMPMVRELAHGSLLQPGEELSVEKHVSMQCWWWSYKTLFLCEYYLRTGDQAVFPTIKEYATKIAMGQSGAGTWGHTYAARENTGYLHGHLGGYGAINQMGLTMMIVLPLAVKCGVDHPEVHQAIKRGDDFFSYFIGKGTIPYGDHGAANEWFDDNGKSGAAAIFFDLMNNRKGTVFFSEMVLASTPGGREAGHTGHFWSHLWGGIGAARGGDKSLQVYMKSMNGVFTLERQPNGRFAFQDNAGENGPKGDPKTKWDSTGARLLQLSVPRRALYITGREMPRATHLTQSRVNRLIEAGRLSCDQAARARLEVDEILNLLKDPLPPIRSVGARTLAERDLNIVDKLIPLLDSENKYARYGAAEALCKAGFGNKAAADKLIHLMETDDDITFQSYAIDALINRDTKRGLLDVANPAIPVLLRMAVKHSPDDPRKVLQNSIATALFYRWNAQPKVGLLHKYGLASAPRELLIPAMKEILTNQNGGARSMLRWVYPELNADEITPLWPDIYASTRHIAPSGIMFASDIRTAGLHAMADHHIKEGLDLAVWYIRYQKGHGAPRRVPSALAAIEKYGAHAKRIIPDLEQHIPYWESRRNTRHPVPPDDPANQIRETIEKIKAMPEPPAFELKSIAKQLE